MRIVLMTVIFSCIAFALTRCDSEPADSPEKKNQTITFPLSTINLKIDSELAIKVTGGLGVGKITYKSSDTRIAKVDKQSAHISPITAGSVDIIATKAGDSTYNSSTTRFRATITKHAQSIMFQASGAMTKTIKDGEFSNTASGGKGSGDITYESNNERVAEVDKKTGRVTITGSGTALITATKAEDEQYASASIQYEIRVSGKQTQEISFSQPGTVTKTITESEFINTASGGDGKGKITYSSSDTKIARVNTSSGAVSLLREGSAVISATKAEDKGYAMAQAKYTIKVVGVQKQRIAFTESGSVSRHLSTESYVNQADGGDGSGEITYTSSNPSVATVDPTTGRVTLISKGWTTIMATKRADKKFAQARVSYQLNVNGAAPNKSSSFSASRILGAVIPAFSANPAPTEETESTETSDESNNNSSSSTSTSNSSSSNESIDESSSENNAQAQEEDNVLRKQLPNLGGHQTVSYNGKLWIIGGQSNSAISNDIFSSLNGQRDNWKRAAPSQRFTPRKDHQVVSFNNRLWLVGGIDRNNKPLNDVWSSGDGMNWQMETGDAGFPARFGHTVTQFDGRLWLIGGANTSTLNDVWWSSNGSTWFKENTSELFNPRFNHQSVAFNKQLWVIGGDQMQSTGGVIKSNDIWSSTDGITWRQVKKSAEFVKRGEHKITVMNRALWMVGGQTTFGTTQDIWSSNDGRKWFQITSTAPFGIRTNHTLNTHNNRLILIGGGGNTTINNESWHSSDGLNWSQ